MNQPLRFPTALHACALCLALAALVIVGAQPASAQLVFDDFNDGNVDNAGSFAGNGAGDAGAGVGPIDGVGGADETGLNLGVNPGSGDAFAGTFIGNPAGGTFDATGQEYFTFFVRPSIAPANLPLTLEITLQEDINGDGNFDPAVEDELRSVYRLSGATADYEFVQIPLATFVDDGGGADDGVDLSQLLNVVFVFGGIGAGPEFTVSFDELVFRDGPVSLSGPVALFDDFNDGNVDNAGSFAGNGAGDAGAGVGPIDGVGGADETGLNLGVNPGSGDAFAGTFIGNPAGGTFDATGQEYFTFFVRPSIAPANLPLTLEITLQEDINGDGNFDPAVEDELRSVYRLSGATADYEFVQIPLATFVDDGGGADDGVDLSQLLNVVFVFGGIGAGPEFTVSFDELGFTGGAPVANEEGTPSTFRGYDLSAAYPNPFQTSARIDLTLDRAEAVRVEVYDVLGRQVAVLNNGTLSAQTPHSFSLEAQGLSNGLYLYRVTGESFSATRRVILSN